ncbi:MAG: DUF123 domain-containing protein [Chlorobiaceae bacterium]
MSEEQFTIFGNKYRMGTYILLIQVSKPFQLAFGRFQNGALIRIPDGDYLYIGSALGREKSGSSLAMRLIRHTSRSSSKAPHQIRATLLKCFSENEFTENSAKATPAKKLRWHIDYFLDQTETEITHIVMVRSPIKLEQKLAELLQSTNLTSLLAPRLGAGDNRNSTHLLKITDQKLILELLRQYIPNINLS